MNGGRNGPRARQLHIAEPHSFFSEAVIREALAER
jgi:hypothetical protein